MLLLQYFVTESLMNLRSIQARFFILCIHEITKREVFQTMRSRDHDVIIVRRTINLGYWEFGMGREWGGVRKGRSVYE
jgi:hypothetical protein